MRAFLATSLSLLLATVMLGCGSSTSDTGGSGSSGSSGAGGSTGGLAGTGGSGASGGTSAAGGTGGASASGGAGGSGGNGGAGASGGASGNAPACPGVEPRAEVLGTTCREPDDCSTVPGGYCSPEFPTFNCGACLPSVRECENDDGCSTGEICAESAIPPCSCDAQGDTSCVPACTDDSCGDDERCADGHCEPISCSDGYTCGELFICAPERAAADPHGCSPRNCNEGYVCGDAYSCDTVSGSCVALHCREGGTAACPVNTECDEGSAGRGCQPKRCEVDADCDCGACINPCSGASCGPGTCQSRLWVCAQQAA